MTAEEKQYNEVTILLVEDDDVDCKGVERALKKLKVANPMVRARDGLEALALLRAPQSIRRPYIILLDINMPRMNGIEFLKEIRNDPALSSSVVFVLTTSKADEDIMSAYRHHVAGYIVKHQMEDGFLRIVTLLDHYWRVVELPAGN